MLLLLKLVLAPLLVALATLVARRWGPKIGGVVVGLPLSTGPIFLFLAIDQGLAFAERACVGILTALVGVAGFALTYTAVSRSAGWACSLAASATSFFVISAIVGTSLPGGVIAPGLAAYLALLIAVSLIRRPRLGSTKSASPWWDIWLRMLATSALTLAVTTAADILGPTFSGIVGTYPIVTTVMIPFTHHQFGRDAAIAMLRGSVLSWIGFASCFLVTGLVLQAYGLATALSLGALATLATMVVVLWIDRRFKDRSYRIVSTDEIGL